MGLDASSTKVRSHPNLLGLGTSSMLAQRLQQMMDDQSLSQSELARRVGVSQTTIRKLVSGAGYGSKHLHRIARELGTTPAYLEGETDDVCLYGPPSSPLTHQERQALDRLDQMSADARRAVLNVMGFMVSDKPVALPSERVLARMFEGLLEVVDLTAPKDLLAQELAQLLPTGLSQLQGLLIEPQPSPTPHAASTIAAAALASVDREPPR